MQDLVNKIKLVLDEKVAVVPITHLEGISINLKNTYTFFDINLLNKHAIVAMPKNDVLISSYIKQKKIIQMVFNNDIIIYLKNANRFEIKELIDNRIDFFAGMGQFYLPTFNLNIKIMLDRKGEDISHEKFTPAMQLTFLYMLYNNKTNFDINELAKNLDLTNMTVSRITREFEKYGLLKHNVIGKTNRKNEFVIEDKKEYYKKGRDYLINPVKNEFYVKNIKPTNIFKNDLSALSDISMINDEELKIYSIYKGFKNQLKNDIISKSEAINQKLYKIQLLVYNPKYLTKTKITDPITMYLSIKDKDERINKEFNKLMRGYEWYEE